MANSQNIAVIGAGVMGLSAAHALLGRGHAVTLYDTGGANASIMAGGMLAPWSEIEHLPREFIDAGLVSIQSWSEITPVSRNGSLFIAHEEDHYILERFRAHLPELKLTDVEELEPMLAPRFAAGLFLKDEAHLNPQHALAALLEKIKATTFKTESATPAALAAQYDRVIDCRGYAAATDDKDLRGVKGETLIVSNPEFNLFRPVRLMHPRYPLYIVPRENNVFMIGATQVECADSDVSLRSGLELMSALYSLHPSFAEARIIEMKAGIRPAYPDNLPRIKISGNVISCNGLFRHGYLLAPVMAQGVADHIAGEHNEFFYLFTGGSHDDDHHKRPEKKLHRAA